MRRLAIVGLVVLAACSTWDDLFHPYVHRLPAGAVSYSPLAEYPGWWAKVEQCSGLTRPMSDVLWFRIPGRTDFVVGGQIVYGIYQDPGLITMAEYSDEWEPGVEHEMLHALLRTPRGQDAHPAEYFIVKCPFVAQNGESK